MAFSSGLQEETQYEQPDTHLEHLCDLVGVSVLPSPQQLHQQLCSHPPVFMRIFDFCIKMIQWKYRKFEKNLEMSPRGSYV